MIANIHFLTWLCLAPGIIAIGGQPPAIFDGSLGIPTELQIDYVAFGPATQLGELRFPHCHDPTGSALCINSHLNMVIHLTSCCFQIFCQNLVIIVWGTWYKCAIPLQQPALERFEWLEKYHIFICFMPNLYCLSMRYFQNIPLSPF